MENKEIVWSELADEDLRKLLVYLKETWSEKVLVRFYYQLELAIQRIRSNPKQFPFANKTKRYRRLVLTKQNTIYYKEFENQILILRLFDTRMKPSKKGL